MQLVPSLEATISLLLLQFITITGLTFTIVVVITDPTPIITFTFLTSALHCAILTLQLPICFWIYFPWRYLHHLHLPSEVLLPLALSGEYSHFLHLPSVILHLLYLPPLSGEHHLVLVVVTSSSLHLTVIQLSSDISAASFIIAALVTSTIVISYCRRPITIIATTSGAITCSIACTSNVPIFCSIRDYFCSNNFCCAFSQPYCFCHNGLF